MTRNCRSAVKSFEERERRREEVQERKDFVSPKFRGRDSRVVEATDAVKDTRKFALPPVEEMKGEEAKEEEDYKLDQILARKNQVWWSLFWLNRRMG